MDLNNKNVIVSRTDSIGDVMLSLPICAWLKSKFPQVRITFLGRGYTRPVLDAYSKIDSFEDWDDYASLPKPEAIKKIRGLNADAIVHLFPSKIGFYLTESTFDEPQNSPQKWKKTTLGN